MAKWIQKSNFKPDLIVEKINKITSVDPSTGRMKLDNGYAEYSFDGLVVVLASMVNFSPALSITQHLSILYTAVGQARTTGELTSISLLGAINRAENFYLTQPQSDYVLVTNISADSGFSKLMLADREINGATIAFTHQLSQDFQTERKEFERLAQDFLDIPHGKYQFVSVKVSAHSASEAVQLAIDSLDLLRAIWIFAVRGNSGLHPRRSSGVPRPLSNLVLGPLHTLHKPSGERATDITTYWFETHYQEPMSPFDVEKNYRKMYDREKAIKDKISDMSDDYKKRIESTFIKYARSLDIVNWDNALLGLWGVLEDLACPNETGYKRTVERAAFLFEDTAYHEQILNHLRTQRNEFAHAGSVSTTSPMQSEILAYQIKFYVERLLSFHIFNNLGFKSITEAVRFLDNATSLEHT